jgi:glycosyltransferase involved in cell wall biosynthesis
MTRVAFVLAGRTGAWLGGLNYYRNLFNAIHRHESTSLEPVLFVGERYDPDAISDFPPAEVHRVRMLDRYNPAWASRTLWRGGLACDRPLGRLLERQRIDALSHSGHLARFKRIPSIGWVPDLQHRRLPELFGKPMWLWRDAKYRMLARFADHLLVGSEWGRGELLDLAPRAASKTSVLHFVVEPPSREQQPELEDLRQRYGFGGRYFYLPNQFWMHKNHRLVVDALRILRDRDPELLVLATGVPYDRRRPGYFEELMDHVRGSGVADSFRVLGVVPYADVTALLRESVALINPSRFEGWSTTVEEAKSLGKRALLSEIPVHVEQAPEGGEYFDPDNPERLAELMWEAWTRDDPAADALLEERARTALPGRLREFVDTYEAAVKTTLDARG